MEVSHTFLTVLNLLLTNIRKVKNTYFIKMTWLDDCQPDIPVKDI